MNFNDYNSEEETETVEIHRKNKIAPKIYSLWDPQSDRFFVLPKKKFTIGKSSEVDIIFDYPSVSRFHAECSVENDRLIIQDLNSRNGIEFNFSKTKLYL